MYIIEEHEMIDLISNYLASDEVKPLVVGGIIGTRVFNYALELANEYTTFAKIRIVEGIQDYIGMHDKIPYNNHNFYAEMFENETKALPRVTIEQIVDGEHNFCMFPVIKKHFKADVIIINDGHMIPKYFMDQIIESCSTKMIIIVDPFDVNGEAFCNVPTVVKTLHKLSDLMAKARLIYHVPTDIIDKKVYSLLDNIKLKQRSYGRIDDAQYITNDENIINAINARQMGYGFRKNQRLIIQDNHIIRSLVDDPDKTKHEYALTKNSIVQIIQGGNTQQFKQLRVYYSKEIIIGRPTFDLTNNIKGSMHVRPANLLNVKTAMNHRFKHIIYIPGNGELSKREFYSMLKATNHLTIVE